MAAFHALLQIITSTHLPAQPATAAPAAATITTTTTTTGLPAVVAAVVVVVAAASACVSLSVHPLPSQPSLKTAPLKSVVSPRTTTTQYYKNYNNNKYYYCYYYYYNNSYYYDFYDRDLWPFLIQLQHNATTTVTTTTTITTTMSTTQKSAVSTKTTKTEIKQIRWPSVNILCGHPPTTTQPWPFAPKIGKLVTFFNSGFVHLLPSS